MSNPFDWYGPDFLRLYALLAVLAVVAATLVRWMVTRTTATARATPDGYELAYLAGGPHRVALLAVYSLVERGIAEFAGRQIRIVARPAKVADHLHRRLMTLAPDSFSPRDVRRMIDTDIEQIRDGLQSQELIARPESVVLSRMITLLAVGGVLAMGVMKIFVGLSRNRPVSLLVFGSALTTGALVLLLRGRFLTSAGRRVLERQRVQRPRANARASSSDDASVAVWGLPALNGHPQYNSYNSSFGSSSTSSGGSSCSSSSSSSCSSSSCSSGCGGCGGGGD